MVPTNISDNLKTNGRTLHLETQFNPEDPYLIQTLYDQGQVLSRFRIHVSTEIRPPRFSEWISEQHQESMEILKFLFEIEERILSLRHCRSLLCLGTLFIIWGLTSQAIGLLKIASDMKTKASRVAQEQLIEAYIRQGDTQKALALLNPLLKKYPETSILWFKRGKIHLGEKNYSQSFDDVKKAIMLHSDLDDIYLLLALICLHLVMTKSSHPEIKSQDSGIRLCMTNLAEALNRTSRFSRSDLDPIIKSLRQRSISDAANQLQGLIDHLTTEERGFYEIFYLFVLYGQQGRKMYIVKRYIKRMGMLISKHPKNSQYHMKLGLGFVVQCREHYQKALDEFHTARSLSGENISKEIISEAEQLGNQFFEFMKRLFQ